MTLELPLKLEPFRTKIEATIEPYVEIQTHLTTEATLWQSKFAGLPYLPKGFDYPKTPEGDYLYLLAQINFVEVPHLEGFPQKGILQFYISAADDFLYGADFGAPTEQKGFRVLFFPDPVNETDDLITDFDFLPSSWNRESGSVPFCIFPDHSPQSSKCVALKFELKSAPISRNDYECEVILGEDFTSLFYEDDSLWEYYQQFACGHKLGGYPYFTQEDPRFYQNEEEAWVLLLQIDSDYKEEGINIMWGDVGVGNFFIKASALQKLDFSNILYNWDCS